MPTNRPRQAWVLNVNLDWFESQCRQGRADFSDFPREGSRREDSHWGPASAGEVYAGATVGNCRPIGRARPGIRTLNHFAFAFAFDWLHCLVIHSSCQHLHNTQCSHTACHKLVCFFKATEIGVPKRHHAKSESALRLSKDDSDPAE